MSTQPEIPAPTEQQEGDGLRQLFDWRVELPIPENKTRFVAGVIAMQAERISALTAERDQARAEAAALREKVERYSAPISRAEQIKFNLNGFESTARELEESVNALIASRLAEPTTQPAPEGDDAK